MNWKNLLKIFSISVAVVLVVLGGLAIWGLSKLPSAFELKQGMTPPALKTKASATSAMAESSEALPEKVPVSPEDEAAPSTAPKDPAEKLKREMARVVLNDFTDATKPIVDSCRTLSIAPESQFFKDPQNASAKYFFENLAEENKDPLVESAAPVFRFMFRAPGMKNVVDMVLKSEEDEDPGLLKKAEFYYEIYRAGAYLKSHTDDFNKVMQQSYNIHHLARAVAQKPELARESAVINFCEDLEKNLNDDNGYDPDLAAEEMTQFLGEAGVDPKSIGYDPKYRAKVKLNISNTQLNMNEAWIAKLFAKDIEKAQKEMPERKTEQ